MTRPDVRAWHAVAHSKLVNVLGDRDGPRVMAAVLGELRVDELRSAADLRHFAEALRGRGGFAEAVAGLLSLHATMYGSAE
ncbi:MAG: hypothetical protein IAG13_29965 [Deltaproteobacteria bacterium]|nr:hypothetical protein [Nannocystaceae bacterium]